MEICAVDEVISLEAGSGAGEVRQPLVGRLGRELLGVEWDLLVITMDGAMEVLHSKAEGLPTGEVEEEVEDRDSKVELSKGDRHQLRINSNIYFVLLQQQNHSLTWCNLETKTTNQ